MGEEVGIRVILGHGSCSREMYVIGIILDMKIQSWRRKGGRESSTYMIIEELKSDDLIRKSPFMTPFGGVFSWPHLKGVLTQVREIISNVTNMYEDVHILLNPKKQIEFPYLQGLPCPAESKKKRQKCQAAQAELCG